MNRFFIDTSEMAFAASIADVSDLPSKQYISEEADRKGLVAIVLPTSPREKEVVQFYKTVCKIRGWNVQAFTEIQEAIKWLTLNNSSNKRDGAERKS